MIQGTKIRGKFKQQIKNMLFANKDLVDEVLLKDSIGMNNKEKVNEFNKVVKSHLFIDDTLTEQSSFIFFDVICPEIETTTQEVKVLLFAICHRDILDNYNKDGYFGNRADILSQIVEDTLLSEENAKQFGIGTLLLDRIDVYNSKEYYGVQMLFDAAGLR